MKNGAILIVDDNPMNLNVMVEVLSAEGYDVAVAMDGESALERAEHFQPEMILLDVKMPPGIDGFETCRRLKAQAHTRDIPVIFMTALAEIEHKVEGFEVGAVDYVTKPLQHEEVLARVGAHMTLRATQKRLEEANAQILEQTERKSRFLASMSHELRTPMNAIQGFTRLVLRHSGDVLPEKDRDNLVKVQESTDHLLNLVNNILDLSQIEAGKLDVNPKSFNVKTLIQACCNAVSSLVGVDVALNCEVAKDVGEAHTDAGLLRQIVTNLLSNALKFTGRGEVRVDCKLQIAN